MQVPDGIARAAKAWLTGIGIIVTAASAALADGQVTVEETGGLIVAALAGVTTIIAVYRTGNRGFVEVGSDAAGDSGPA